MTFQFMKFGVITFATIVAALSITAFAAGGSEPLTGTEKRSVSGGGKVATGGSRSIVDTAGRIRYIVDIIDDKKDRPTRFADAKSKIDYHRGKATQLIADVVDRRGVELVSTTSLIGISFTAHLTDKQVKQLSEDQRVRLITPDQYLNRSALWNSVTTYGNELNSWGLYAMGVAQAGSSNGSATVYVLDTGVELHSDLPGYISGNQLSAMPGVIPTGCYPHATHVAGIVGAGANYTGIVGVLPGVRIVSIALGEINSTTSPCPGAPTTYGSYNQTANSLIQALHKVYENVLNTQKVAVVNLSFNNPNLFAATETVGAKMLEVSTPFLEGGAPYKGALIVQSAGNLGEDACTYAFGPASSTDGILVVGGLDANGQQVVPLHGPFGYLSEPVASDEIASNTGNCVEAWAPSQRIKSTYTGNSYAVLSGTSMAAPHVAGFAARLLESDPSIDTSEQLEFAVRSSFVTIGGSNLSIPQMANQYVTALPSIEVVEGNPISNRSTAQSGTMFFNKLAEDTRLEFGSFGSSYCVLYVTKDGSYYSYTYGPSNFGTNSLPTGAYDWTLTCYTAYGTQNSVTVSGQISNITLGWSASTANTPMQPTPPYPAVTHGGTVNWYVPSNDPFDQIHASTGASDCRVRSYGYVGNNIADPDRGQGLFNGSVTPAFSHQILWDSNDDYPGGFPTYYQYARFNFSDPAPWFGYKWLLTCKSVFGLSKSTVMYGEPHRPF